MLSNGSSEIMHTDEERAPLLHPPSLDFLLQLSYNSDHYCSLEFYFASINAPTAEEGAEMPRRSSALK